MEAVFFGIVMPVRLVQFAKARFPIVFTLSGNFTEDRFMQDINVSV